jgi:hypothetical protein
MIGKQDTLVFLKLNEHKKVADMNLIIDESIPGWSWPRDLRLLAMIAKMVPDNGIVVEAGCYLGRSSYAIAANLKPTCTLHAIDVWNTDLLYFSVADQISQFEKNNTKGSKEKLQHAARLAEQTGSWYPGWALFTQGCNAVPFKMRIDEYVIPNNVCAVFIDGNHTYDDVIADIRKFNVNEEILLIGDDFCWTFPDVTQAVGVIKEETGRTLVSLPDSATWFLWPRKGTWANKLNMFLNRAGRDLKYLRGE